MEGKKNNGFFVKIILLGEMHVGKTSLIKVYLDESKFNPLEITSGQPSQSYKSLEINKTELNICLWDTMGQEKFRSLTKTFIKNSNIVILVYDITNRVSFLELNYWLNVSREELQNEVIFGVVGNKVDLFNNCEVEKEEGEEYAKNIGALFTEASAKENPIGFRNFIKQLLEKLLSDSKIVQKLQIIVNEKKKNIQLSEDHPYGKKKKCC